MTAGQFRATLSAATAPDLPRLLLALWHDHRGDWERAHTLAQDVDSPEGSWVHAYLHRREGDLGNARYWYRRAGRAESVDSLEAEFQRLVDSLTA
jgi:hypothetical protein